MVDLYTALKLCSNEDYIRIYGQEYTPKHIRETFDLRKVKVSKIYFDRWHGCMVFEAKEV